jgi:hypothetical protein
MKEATHYPPISYCAISFPYHEINSDYDYVTDVLVHCVVSCCFNSTLARPRFFALRLVKLESGRDEPLHMQMQHWATVHVEHVEADVSRTPTWFSRRVGPRLLLRRFPTVERS